MVLIDGRTTTETGKQTDRPDFLLARTLYEFFKPTAVSGEYKTSSDFVPGLIFLPVEPHILHPRRESVVVGAGSEGV